MQNNEVNRKNRLIFSFIGALLCMLALSACNYSGIEIDRSNALLLMEAVANTRAATSYHVAILNKSVDGGESITSGSVDTASHKVDYFVNKPGSTRHFVRIGADLFVSQDQGESYFEESANYGTDNLDKLLDGFDPMEAAKAEGAFRNGEPLIENIDGAAVKHMLIDYQDVPSLINLPMSEDSPEPGMMEIWVTLGEKPTIRRLKVTSAESEAANMAFEWSKLDEPVTIEKPETVVSNLDLLLEAARNMSAISSFEMDASITQGTTDVDLYAAIDTANNTSKMVVEASGIELSLITVGGISYMSMDGGLTYVESYMGEELTSTFGRFTEVWDNITTARPGMLNSDLISNGVPLTEMIDGRQTRHIVIAADPFLSLTSAGSKPKATLDLWISTGETPYILQMTIDGIVDGQKIEGTFNWSHFNKVSEITAPDVEDYYDPYAGYEEAPRISIAEFKAMYDDPANKPLVLDVRVESLYEEGHIAGAISFPEAYVDYRVDELPRDRMIVTYCHCPNEEESARVAQVLHDYYDFSYDNLKVLEGGWYAWEDENYLDPLEYPIEIGTNDISYWTRRENT